MRRAVFAALGRPNDEENTMRKTKPFDPNSVDARRALFQAALMKCDAVKVQALLDQGVNVHAWYKTSLIAEDAYKALLNRGADPERLGVVEAFFKAGYPYHTRLRIRWTVTEDFPIELLDLYCKYPAPMALDYAGMFDSIAWLRDREKQTEQVLVAKLRKAHAAGYWVAKDWVDGELPYHLLLKAGLVEAALACVELGTDPNEPVRKAGLVRLGEGPYPFVDQTWAAVMTRLEAKQRGEALQALAPTLCKARRRA